MKILGLIPARRGSKRVKGKNMALLGGKPLLQWTIEAAKESKVFEQILVSSDWPECFKLAFGQGVGWRERPAEFCRDESHDYEWARDALIWTVPSDLFVILRPTSPFRTAETIKRAVREFLDGPQCDSMRAVERTPAHPKKSWELGNVYMYPYDFGDLNGFPCHDLATQSLGDVYCQNGCIHIAWTATLEKFGNVSGELIRPFFTEGREGIDINTPEDLRYAEWLMGRG